MPVRKDRRRYIVYKVLSERVLEGREILRTIRDSTRDLFGEVGMGRITIKPIFYDDRRREGVIRCAHTDLWDLRAAMALIDSVGSDRASILVKGVSGTLKTAKKKFLSEEAVDEDQRLVGGSRL